jgi:hypothetical protein
MTVTSDDKASIVEAVLKTINELYIFPEVAGEIEKHVRARMKSGEYEYIQKLEEFTQALTTDLRVTNGDNHLLVFPHTPPDIEEGELGENDDDETDEMRNINYGFQCAEILSGNVGYLNITMFTDPVQGGSTAVATMNFLAGVDALIVDLRDNGGGRGDMVSLICSYFFQEATHLTSNYYRAEDFTEQSWTSSYVQGPRLIETPLFILTSSSTFSAAEEFAYVLKHLGRATVIGERTRGGAHPINYRAFPEWGVKVMVPSARSINPITGSNWEGTGVEPDMQVDADQAFDIAYLEALKGLLKGDHPTEKSTLLEWSLKSVEADIEPIQIDETKLKSYAGQYGDITIQISAGDLVYQRDGRRPYKLIPIGADLFKAGKNTMFIQYTRGEDGEISGLMTTFNDGYTIHRERS